MKYLTYISINVPNINQLHSKTSELLSENKTLAKSLTLLKGEIISTVHATELEFLLYAVPYI